MSQTSREKKRTTSILTGLRGTENHEQLGSSQRIESLTDRATTTSPLTGVLTNGGSTFFQYEGDTPDIKIDEPLALISAPSAMYNTASAQGSAYKNTAESLSLSKYHGQSEFRLPKLPELYHHKRGYSSPNDIQSLPSLPILPKSTLTMTQGLEALSGTISSHINSFKSSGPTLAMPVHRVSPRVFNLNLNSPTSVINVSKISKNDASINTPKTLDGGLLGLNTANINLESYRIPSSASQLSLKKTYESGILTGLQLPTHFKGSLSSSGQKAINDVRSPIRVVDMGTSQLILTNKSKETYQ